MLFKTRREKIKLLLLILGWWSLMFVARGTRVKNVTRAITRQIRSAGFPEGSAMGIFFALSIPLGIPNKAVSVSFYFEASYILPGDKKFSEYGEYQSGERSFDRRLAYEILENKLIRAGYPGRVCLMRAICDAAKKTVAGNGVIGDLLHIILTPSTSRSDNVDEEITEAEYEKNCDERYRQCPIKVLDLISYYI